MPSAAHQNFIFLLREHLELAVSLARCAGAPLPEDSPPSTRLVVEASGDIDVPVQLGRVLRADFAVSSRGPDGQADWSLGFEIQLGSDPDKRWSIPHYQTGLSYNLRCPAWVVVFSPESNVRRFVSTMYPFKSDLRPLVIEPWMVPPIRDLAVAIADPARAVLAATLHAHDPDTKHIAKTALQAMVRSPLRERSRYVQLITNAIGAETMKQIITELPEEDLEPLSDWERRGASFVRGKEEGLEQGLEQGLAGLRATVYGILAARGMEAAPEDRAWLDGCPGVDELRQAAIRAATIEKHERLRPTDASAT